jgi:CzcA family heavy metal efflux pump
VALVLGSVFIGDIPLDLLPRIVYPSVRVNVSNPGVEPGVIEETIAKPLESALSTTENVTRVETEIREGSAGVNLHFPYGINPDIALQNASTNLNRARSQLPEEASPPTIGKQDPSQSPVYEVAFSSAELSLMQLRNWVDERLKPQILMVEGVASVDVSGGLVREMRVTLDQERLQSYGITVSEVITALRTANQDVAAGRIGSTEHEVVGKTEGKFRSIADIRGVLLDVGGGRRVPLTEVASVVDTVQRQRLWARLTKCEPVEGSEAGDSNCPAGVQAVRVSVRKQPDGNTVSISDNVEAKLRLLEESNFIPGSVDYEVIRKPADFIRNSLYSVQEAAVLGALLSMIIVLLFLGSLRKTLVIGLAIPIAILATFVLMGMADLTLNIMSLGGLALGVGMLVDNSIVMLENIFRKRDEEGIEDPEEAAHEGAAEVTSAVTAATTTHIAAVVPFLLVTGLTALVFRELILTISFSIAASLAVALTLVPMLSAQFAKVKFSSGIGNSRALRAFDRGMDRMREWYRAGARVTLRRPAMVVAGGVLSLVAAYFLTRNLGSEFLPQVDDGNVGVSMNLRPGSTPEQTNALSLEVERMVREMPHIQSMFATAGGAAFGGATANSSGRGNIDVRLVPLHDRGMSADEWVTLIQAKVSERGFPGARVFARPPRIQGLRTNFAGSDISIAIQGDALDTLQQIARDIASIARGTPGLQNMEASTEEAAPILSIRLDRERAGYLGLNVAAVGQTLRTALDGTVATRYAEGNREFDVRVMLPREKFSSPEDLGAVALFPGGRGGGAPVYLRDVADVGMKLAPTGIRRENQNRIIRLNGDVVTEEVSIGEVTDSIRNRVAELEIPDGYSVIMGGENEAIRDNNRQLVLVAALAIFLVFVVMAIQYESIINPLVILVAVPLSLVGVGMALWVTQTPLSAPVLLGVILLAGIVVNNSILVVEYAEEYRQRPGVSLEEAVISAGAVRLRPILMTTLTTLLGMTPLALGIGEGTEMMQPLAIAVIGGLSISTILTLLVVPSAYVTAQRAGDRLKTWLTGGAKPVPVASGGD